MTVRVYRSTDASAPVLTGQVGSLVALLDACLVNGYGAISGAGWTKALAGTNKGAYKQNIVGSNNSSGMYLYVDDTAPGAGGAREARVCGFETMSAITPAGTGQFPTVVQSTIGVGTVVIRKSITADTTARPWTIVANGQTIYLWTESGDQLAPLLGACTFVFGDFKSYKTNDQYAVGIIGRTVENNGLGQYEVFAIMGITGGSLNSKIMGHYVARSWTAVGGSIQVAKTYDYSKFLGNNSNYNFGWINDTASNLSGGSTIMPGRLLSGIQWPAPNGPDGGLFVSPLTIFHSWAHRGYWPGLWIPLQDRPLNHNDVVTVASGNLNGKTLLCQQINGYSGIGNDFGIVLVETSDTWS